MAFTETTTQEPTLEERELATEIQKKYTVGKQRHKEPFEKTWFISNCFVMGQHYVTYNAVERIFQSAISAPEHRKKATINWPFAYYRRTKSKLTAGRPVITVYPATNDQEDKDRAKVSNHLIDYLWEKLEIQELRSELVGWMLKCGCAIYHPHWNPLAGEKIKDIETGREFNRGEVAVEVISPLELVIDPYATKMSNARWLIWSKLRPANWIKQAYPNKPTPTKQTKTTSTPTYERRFQEVVGVFGFTSQGTQMATEDGKNDDAMVLIHQYWERPTTEHPNGRLVVSTDDYILLQTDCPYSDLPFIKCDEIEVEGRFWGMATVEQTIPLTRNLNKARSEQMENRILARPKILTPKTCNIPDSAFTDEAGEFIKYDIGPRGEAPTILNPTPPSNAHTEDIKQTTLELQELSGWHEVSRGMLPSADTSGRAIELLQYSDDSQIASTMRQLERSDEKLARWMLHIARKYYTEERTIRIVGKDNELLVEKVLGENIEGRTFDADYYDVRVKTGSGFLKSREDAKREVEWGLATGLLKPDKDMRVIRQMIEFPTTDAMLNSDNLDEQWAQKENALLAQGRQDIAPREYEDHAVHIDQHNRYRKTTQYRELMETAPQIDKLFQQHMLIHYTYINPQAFQDDLQPTEEDQEIEPQQEPGLPEGDQTPESLSPPQEDIPPPEEAQTENFE